MKKIIAVELFSIFWLTTMLLSAFNKDLMRINNCVVIFSIAVLLFAVSFVKIPKLNDLFSNSGLYLKKISKGIFVISEVCLILALVIAFVANVDMGILSIKLFVGEIVILICSLMLYGYGEIVEGNKNRI